VTAALAGTWAIFAPRTACRRVRNCALAGTPVGSRRRQSEGTARSVSGHKTSRAKLTGFSGCGQGTWWPLPTAGQPTTFLVQSLLVRRDHGDASSTASMTLLSRRLAKVHEHCSGMTPQADPLGVGSLPFSARRGLPWLLPPASSRTLGHSITSSARARTVRENFVACDVLSQLQRVMDNPRFLLTGECR
jgi:hypothetical protein